MSTRKLQLPVSGFTDGLNTEASGLNILPSEMMSGSTNVELFQNGSVRRRRGIDFIGTSTLSTYLNTLRTSTVSEELQQESPAVIFVSLTAPNGSIVQKVVADLNNEFLIFDATNTALRNINSPTQTIVRTVSTIVYADPQQKYVNMQFAQSGNRLFFAGKHIQPGYMQVASDNASLEVVYISVIIRDPSANVINTMKSDGGKYYSSIKAHTSSSANKPGAGADWEEFWILNEGAIPSTVAAWGTGQSYTSSMLKRYDKDTSVTSTDTFPTTVDFYAGRAWFAGDPKYPNNVYFSQVVANDADLEKYHQFADPFDTLDSVLAEDDGGVIAIQGAGLVKRLMRLGANIFVGSNTGIWQITGPSGIFKATNFTAYAVLKDGIDGPANMVAIDDEFVVFGQDTIWRSVIQTNIYVSTTGQASFKSLSENRVESVYTAIPKKAKASARAVYNPSERRVYYFHNKEVTAWDNAFNSLEQPGYSKDVLIIDTRFQDEILPTEQQQKLRRNVKGAFFTYEYNDGANNALPYIACPFTGPDMPNIDETVLGNSTSVTDSNGQLIIAAGVEEPKDVVLALALQRTTSGDVATVKGAFATFNTKSIKDWNSSPTYAISYNSPIYSGVQTGGDALHNKNLTYLYLVFKKAESGILDADGVDLTQGGCYLGSAWDFAVDNDSPGHTGFWKDVEDSNGNKVTNSAGVEVYKRDPMRQVYHGTRYTKSIAGDGDDGYDHVYYKHRVRGRGHVFQVQFHNDNDKDYHLVGWVQQFYGKPD
tara:strand:+ start:11086 stop:13380 length:2295 start_codon:yes stop_codon:yes gene_type:complete